MKNQEISREKDYVQRVFYLSDYAKELRLTQMYQVMLQKMKRSVAGLKETVSQYGFSIMTLEYILALLYEVGVYFVSILVAVYRTLVSKTMLLGDCFVVINSLTNIAYLVVKIHDLSIISETSWNMRTRRRTRQMEKRLEYLKSWSLSM